MGFRDGPLFIPLLLCCASCLDPIPANTLAGPEGEGRLIATAGNACDPAGEAIEGATLWVDGSRAYRLGRTATQIQLSAGHHNVYLEHGDYSHPEESLIVTRDESLTRRFLMVPKAKPKQVTAKLDVLFVIDDSASMGEEQQTLVAGFPRFLDVLRNERLRLDLQVGVISTTMGDLGAGHPECTPCHRCMEQCLAATAPITPEEARQHCEGRCRCDPSSNNDGGGGYLRRPRGPGCPTSQNPWLAPAGLNAGEAAHTFACMAQLGTGGCSFEQPLFAITQALGLRAETFPPPQNWRPDQLPWIHNEGFVRSDALLAIIVVTDEDDCSARSNESIDIFRFLSPDQQRELKLGPLSSFRCFSQGVRCDGDNEGNKDRIGRRKDCVPEENSRYLASVEPFVKALIVKKNQRERIFFGTIAGPLSPVVVGTTGAARILTPSCADGNGSASPPVRLGAVVDAFSPRSRLSAICSDDYGALLEDMADHVVQSLLKGCAQ